MTAPNPIVCPECGTLNRPGTKYCSNCRTVLISMSTLSIGRQEIDERDPTLRVIPDSGTAFTALLLEKIMDIGSEPRQHIAIQTLGISPRHARLTLEAGKYRLFSIVGGNGVLVNGEAIDTILLKDGDTIRLQDRTGRGVTMTYSNPVEHAANSAATEGQLYAFSQFPFTIGRNPQSNIKLEALSISWNHALIMQENGKHILRDLKSTNGTYVNDRRLSGPHRLEAEDVIRIDRVQLVYKGTGLIRLPSVLRFQLDGVNLEMTYRNGFPPRSANTMRGITVAIEPQEFIAVIGGSGSGKSTFLRALNGAQRATSGQVRVNGDDLYEHYGMYQPIIGYVPQTDIVQNDLTVYETLMYGAQLRFPHEPHASRQQRIERVLESLELTDYQTQLVRSLSGGQRKRVSIALELMAEPGLLFMDEPSSGLDPGLDKSMMDTLRRLADRGHVVLVVTHTTLNIAQCDYLVVMARGNLAYFGPPHDALNFFGVRDYPDIYNRVLEPVDEDQVDRGSPSKNAAEWANFYKNSSLYPQHVTARLVATNKQEAIGAVSTLSNKRLRRQRQGTIWHQARVLTARTFTLTRRSLRTILILLLVLPLVGLFLSALNFDRVFNTPGKMLVSPGRNVEFIEMLEKVPLTQVAFAQNRNGEGASSSLGSDVKATGTYNPAGDAQRLLFMITLAVTLLGIFASAYTIVEEKTLYLRERMVNLRIPPYLASKVIVFGGLGIVSCILLLLALLPGVQIPQWGVLFWGPLEMLITLALTVLAGVGLGLLLSALLGRVNAVTYVMLLIIFIQILFPGVLFKMPSFMEPLARLTITRWSLEALGATANMPQRDAEAKIIVLRPVLDKDNKPIPALGDSRQFIPAPSTLNFEYPNTPGDLVVRWAALAGFAAVFLVGAALALNRSESF